MTPENIIISLIVAVFLTFMVVLFWVSIYVRLGDRKALAPARRAAPPGSIGDRAAV
jgi:hypothetical protein